MPEHVAERLSKAADAINALDHEFQKERSLHRSPVTKPKNVTRNLNNFERRSYDMDSLEEQLLKSN